MKKFIYPLLCLFITITSGAQQNSNIWTKLSTNKANVVEQKVLRKTEPLNALYYTLDINKLKTDLGFYSKKTTNKNAAHSVSFPNSSGGFDTFNINESSILEANYQAKHPELRTYLGFNTANPSSTITLSITPTGLYAMIMSSQNGTQFIDPYTKNNQYIVYKKSDLPTLKKAFECLVSDNLTLAKQTNANLASKKSTDSKLRTFKLALASTIEYSEFHWREAGLAPGDSDTDKKSAVLAAMVTTMNRVNMIYQRDLAIKMILVDNEDIIFIDSDDFTNNNANRLIDESQTVIDNAIGNSNYDVGHTFSTGAGGLASLNSPCSRDRKAQGVTGLANPIGDPYDVDFVAHEFGHQFGAPHTFNGNAGNCSGNNRASSNAYEVGSGTTIMGYAGICGAQNVQLNSDAYFHQKSIQMILDNVTSGISTCGAETTLANSTPVADAGPDYTIPISTPFRLAGSSSDPDGTDSHSYTWEQYDLGPAGVPLEVNDLGPLTRSFEGTTNPVRSIPRYSDYLETGGSTTWEKLPAVNRTMTFALTVRDNDVAGPNGGGQTDVDFMTINVNSTDAFTVVNPSSWAQGNTENIEWNVGQTADVNTINCQLVNIKLSLDSGLTFPIDVATNVPNNGLFTYAVPSIPDTNTARILIEAADNIFYDISDFDFSISDVPDFFITNEILSPISCGETEVKYTFDYSNVNGFSENIVFSASNIPNNASTNFSPANRATPGPVTLTISNLQGVQQGNYKIIITGSSTASTKTKEKEIDFAFFNDICPSSGNTRFETSTTNVKFNTISNATDKTGYSDFKQISTDVNRNTTYPLTINVNSDGNFAVTSVVWIDWNQDCDFDDDGERYELGIGDNVSDGQTSLSPLDLIIPSDALIGSTVMRVTTKFTNDGAPRACENDFDGEVEDYTINVQDSTLSVETFESGNLNVFPNPSKGRFEISLKGPLEGDVKLEVYNISGRLITQKTYTTAGDFKKLINLESLSAGLYILKISDNVRSANQKLVIK